MRPTLATLLTHYIQTADLGPTRLQKLVDKQFQCEKFVPRRTIENWRDGLSKTVQDWRQLAAVAAILSLDKTQVNELLQVAGHKPIDTLWSEAAAADKRFLRFWTAPNGVVKAAPAPTPLPPGSYLPHEHNPLFMGREAELEELARLLLHETDREGGGMTQTAVVSGLGGIGKTQLAVAFGYRYGRFFPGGVYWLNMERPENVPAEIALLGGVSGMGLHPEFENLAPEIQKRLLMRAWQQPTPRLLIFDNCETEEMLTAWRPPTGGCRVLVTSRRGEWSPSLGMKQFRLKVLAREKSVAFLRRCASGLTDTEAEALAAEVGDLPLALHVVGSFMAAYEHDEIGTPAAVLAQLQDPALLQRPALTGLGVSHKPTGHDLHVARTFAVSFDQLDSTDEIDRLALRLLTYAACLAPGETIPRFLLTGMVAAEGKAVQVAMALKRLITVGLLTPEPDGGVSLHRLLALYTQEVTVTEMAQTRKQVEAYIAGKAAELNQTQYPPALLAWHSHLRYVAEQAAARKSEQMGELLNELGFHLKMIADYEGARHCYESALAIREKRLGWTHPHTAASLHNLGFLLARTGEYGRARQLIERALTIRQRVLGEAHPQTESSLNNLGVLLYRMGKYEEARHCYENALSIRQKGPGWEHPHTAMILNNLGFLLYRVGNYEKASVYLQQALLIREKVLGTEHPHTAQSLNNLGLLLKGAGDYQGATAYLERALAINEQVLGKEHPETACSLNNMGLLWQKMGHYEKARHHFERALKIREKALGSQHPDTATSLDSLGLLLEGMGQYESAQHYIERALKMREKVLGEAHPDTAVSLNAMGLLLQGMGQHKAAYLYLERALKIREKVLGRAHPDTASSLNNLGLLVQKTDGYQAARPYFEQAVAILEQKLGTEHPHTKVVREKLQAPENSLIITKAALLASLPMNL